MDYLDHFIPIFVNSGERAQTALEIVYDMKIVWLILGYWGTLFTYAWVTFVTYFLKMLFLWSFCVLAIC